MGTLRAGFPRASAGLFVSLMAASPAPPAAPQAHQQDFGFLSDLNPGFVLFGTVIMAGILRAMLGRLIGAGVAGGVALLARLAVGSIWGALLVGGFVFFWTLMFDHRLGKTRWLVRRGGSSSGGSWGGSDSSSSSDSGGGGGSFGGGGASGSW